MRTLTPLSTALLCAACLAAPSALALTIDFETRADSEPLGLQYAGLNFSNATAVHAGVTLNEFEFPPHSGSVAVFDDGGPLSLRFAGAVDRVSAYFTYLQPLTLTVFDAFDNVLGSVGSAFASNLALSGDPGSSANEFIELAFAGIRRLTISADPAGSSFVLDDLAYRSAAAVPEPASALLVAAGIAGLALRRRRQEAR